MPRDGATTFDDLRNELGALRVACDKCGRPGPVAPSACAGQPRRLQRLLQEAASRLSRHGSFSSGFECHREADSDFEQDSLNRSWEPAVSLVAGGFKWPAWPEPPRRLRLSDARLRGKLKGLLLCTRLDWGRFASGVTGQ
jgi:hypothetical protein